MRMHWTARMTNEVVLGFVGSLVVGSKGWGRCGGVWVGGDGEGE